MKNQINSGRISAAEKILVDNGVDADEASVVLQAIGYALLDTELYPETAHIVPESKNGNLYDVTITRTGGICVYADSIEEAFDKVNSMTTLEIDRKGNLTGWEPSDIELLEKKK